MGLVILTNNPELIEFLDQFVDPGLDCSGDEYDHYWCINIKPFVCGGCGSIVAYAQCGNHFIIIWEKKDDDDLIELAKILQSSVPDYEPRVVKYNRILGPCIEYNEAVKRGMIEGITHD